MERSKNASRNLLWGLINKIITILAQFVIRMALVRVLGEEYLGLNNLFAAVINVLSLAELGIGSAMVFNMYRAIVEDDKVTICALLQLYKKCYHIIALVIAVIGVAVMPLLPFIVSTGLPDGLNLYVLYLFNLASTVISYSLFSYKSCLLEAHQRSDMVNKIASFVHTLQYVAQIIILFVLKNYYLYCVVTPCIYLLSNFLTSFVVDRQYPEYRPKGKLDEVLQKNIFQKVKALFIYKAGGVVSSSFDSIILSWALGLVVLGKFSSYNYVITMLFSFLLMYNNAITAGIGNSIVSETVDKNFTDFKKLLLMQAWICGFCASALLCLYQGFIGLWMGEEMLLEMGQVICFVVYFYSFKIQDTVTVYKDGAGLWEQDRWRPMVSAIVNLILNVTLVQFIGIYGILLSTILCCLFIDIPWGAAVLFKQYFKKGLGSYYLRLISYTAINVLVAAITFGACYFIPTGALLWEKILWFVLKMAICVVVPNLLYLLVYFRTDEFKRIVVTVKNTLRSFFKKKQSVVTESVAQEVAQTEEGLQEKITVDVPVQVEGLQEDVGTEETKND